MTGQRTTADEAEPPTVDESGTPPVDESGTPPVDEAVERIHDQATTIRDRELETALSKLEASGDISPSDREAVVGLADRLVEELVAVPESSLHDAAAAGNEENGGNGRDGDHTGPEPPVETALELFS